MPDSNQTIIDRVRSGTGTTAMEYTEYRNDVLALCNFAEQVQIDLARVTAELSDYRSGKISAMRMPDTEEFWGIEKLREERDRMKAERDEARACTAFEHVTVTTLRARVAELEAALREEKRIHPEDFQPGDFRERALSRVESAAPLPMREDPRYRGTDFRSAIDTTP